MVGGEGFVFPCCIYDARCAESLTDTDRKMFIF